MMLIIHGIPNWTCAAVAFLAEHVFSYAAINFFSRIDGIILCKALQNGFRQNASAPEEITSVAETTRTLFFLSSTL